MRAGRGAWGVLVLGALPLAGCPFGPSLPIEEEPPNLPPLISREFLVPGSDAVTIPRDGEPVVFGVSQLLDMNEADKLEVRWYSAQAEGDQVLGEAILRPDLTNTGLYRDIFTRYSGTQYTLDPCEGLWPRAEDRFTLTVFVADGDLLIESGRPVVPEGVYVDLFTWVLDFVGECPNTP